MSSTWCWARCSLRWDWSRAASSLIARATHSKEEFSRIAEGTQDSQLCFSGFASASRSLLFPVDDCRPLYIQPGAADPLVVVLLQIDPLAVRAEIRAEVVHVDESGVTGGVEVDLAEVGDAGIAGPLILQLRTGIDAGQRAS